LNPQKLILIVEDKIRVLKHADAWTIHGTKETPAMALTASPVLIHQLKEFLAKHIPTELKCLASSTKPTGKDGIGKEGKQKGRFQHQAWMFLPPNLPSDTKTVNDRTYHWCTKCNRGNGQWVLAHTTNTHREDFVPSYCKTDSDKKLLETKDLKLAFLKGTPGSKFEKVHFDLQNRRRLSSHRLHSFP
jgi:hypothetical protein